MRKFAWLLPVCAVLATLLVVVRPASAAPTPFSFNWSGTPAAPQSVVPEGWDVQIHKREPGDDMEPMDAQHGPACEAPPATHRVSLLKDGVFICKNHLMTAMNDGGYGEIVLTPDRMVDISDGVTTTVNWSVSTQVTSFRDWYDVWLTPYADNLVLPLNPGFQGVDLQGPPKNAIEISLISNGICGGASFGISQYVNFVEKGLPGDCTAVENLVSASAATRTQFQVDLSTTHLRFGLPSCSAAPCVGGHFWYVDANLPTPLTSTQYLVQLAHHSYNPTKDCTPTTCLLYTSPSPRDLSTSRMPSSA